MQKKIPFKIFLVLIIIFFITSFTFITKDWGGYEEGSTLAHDAITLVTADDLDPASALLRSQAAISIVYTLNCLGYDRYQFPDSQLEWNDLISMTIDTEILHGDQSEKDLRLYGMASREEVFVMVASALNISSRDEKALNRFTDRERISPWAVRSVAGLVKKGYISGDGSRLRPTDRISIREMEILLGRVCERTGLFDHSFKFIFLNYKQGVIARWNHSFATKIFYFFCVIIPTLLPLLAQCKKLWDYFLYHKIIIIFAGNKASGKTALNERLKTPALARSILRKRNPTRKLERSDTFIIQSSQDQNSINGQAFDSPGGEPEHVIRLLSQRCVYPPKVLIIVLAHTKTDISLDEIDTAYLKEQLTTIQKTWVPMLKVHCKNLKQLIVFLNKTDLLSDKNRPAEDVLYTEHINSINDGIAGSKLTLQVVEGSSLSGDNMDLLKSILVRRL